MTEKEWLEKVGAEAFQVMRQKGTERPFTSEFCGPLDSGVYRCKGCDVKLFETNSQFDAGCGWPSFDRADQKSNIKEVLDKSHGMTRVEVRCVGCDSHLGHVFNDGPTETGMRYCINGICLVHSAE